MHAAYRAVVATERRSATSAPAQGFGRRPPSAQSAGVLPPGDRRGGRAPSLDSKYITLRWQPVHLSGHCVGSSCPTCLFRPPGRAQRSVASHVICLSALQSL